MAEGETLTLRLLLHNDARVHSAFLILKNDADGSVRETKMKPGGYLEDYRFYECEINLTEGLYWYSFRYTSDYGEFFVKKTDTSLGIVTTDGGEWQQTVYERNFKTPDWLSGGIIYQIFPDRFYASGEKKENVPPDRFLCDDWQKIPEYRQTGEKCRLGNDYYGGDLKGIEQKLDYLASLSVSCIYLNPIFEAHSNHRYNTADYGKIDPLLGTEEDLCSLIKAAEKRGISIILDGVFSHTGDDSVYFNRFGRYDSIGAAQSQDSEFYSWYKFDEYPEKYAAWWGVPSLPETNENDLSFSNYITGENGIIRYWLKKGIKGWRLDVADELPDEFLDKIRIAVKSEGEDNFLLGEVWEDASNKISYGARRRFLRGRQLDSVMNYPFADAIVAYLKGGDSSRLANTVLDITENYPPQAVKLLMNHIGTHDTARILTRLGKDELFEGDRERQSKLTLSPEEYEKAVKLLKAAAVLQYTLPGVPSVFYGDEAGVTGCSDPFCRVTFPWGRENGEITEIYKKLGKIRKETEAFAGGDFVPVISDGGIFAFMRQNGKSRAFIAVNRSDTETEITLPDEVLKNKTFLGEAPKKGKVILPPLSFSLTV